MEEHCDVKRGLYPSPNSRKQGKTNSLLKHIFLNTVTPFHKFLFNMCDTDSYLH